DRCRWPHRWRRALRQMLGPRYPVERGCTPACPLYGRYDIPHRHFRLRLKAPDENLGCLHFFRVSQRPVENEVLGTRTVYSYNFRGGKSHHPDADTQKQLQSRVDAVKRVGRLFSIYLPAWVFGPPVLEDGPCRALQVISRELTRVPSGR